jgi:GNAT superfamily N-acetyltransferase
MIFLDLSLAQRLERHEAWGSAEHARTQARLYPETSAVWQPIADGVAVFCGKRAPISGVCGWGLSEPVRAADLDMAEAFYRSRDMKMQVAVCPFADRSLPRLLGERGYIIQDYMNVYARELGALGDGPLSRPGLSIRTATPDDARRWFELSGAGGDWAEPDGVTFMTIRCTLKSDTQLFLAWLDGHPVCGGGLELHDGVAALMAGGTLPAYRNQGIHAALLHARLAAATEAGCDLALVHSRPGTISQRNILRAGFELVYTNLELALP